MYATHRFLPDESLPDDTETPSSGIFTSPRHTTTTAREPMCFSSHTKRGTPSLRK
jgi:hypothetical protein